MKREHKSLLEWMLAIDITDHALLQAAKDHDQRKQPLAERLAVILQMAPY